MSVPQQPHQLRFSLDIKSIKDHDFLGQVYVKFSPVPELGINKQFRTNPLLQLSTAKVEEIFQNGFSSHYFTATRATLNNILNKVIDIELWHSDRMKKDILIGILKLEVDKLLDSPVRKTKEGHINVRVFDAYLPVDELNESGEILRKVAAMRVLMYLEDLGPVSGLKFLEEDLGIREQLVYQKDVDPPMLPSQNHQLSTQDRMRQIQLNELEYKVVWQLQTWRKAQEAKTKIYLKQKEVEYLAQLAEEQRKVNLEKEKQFKKIQGNLVLKEKKLQEMAVQLQKREQKLVLLDQEMQNKTMEMSRYCLSKDQTVSKLEIKHKEDRTAWMKQKAGLEAQIHNLKGENTRLKMDLQQANKEDDKSPINIIRNELNNRISDNKMLMKSLQDANEVKKLYEESYEKMRNEVIYLKKEMESKKSKMEMLTTQNQVLKSKQKLLYEQLNLANQNLRTQQPQFQQPHPQMYNSYQNENNQQPVFSNNIEKLKYDRHQYLKSGNYTVNDPLIKEYDKLIAEGY